MNTSAEDILEIVDPLVQVLEQHVRNQEEVEHLLEFDNVILTFCITSIEALEGRLKNNEEIKLTPAHHYPSQTIAALKGIRDNGSLRPQYQHMYNQSVVLSVSYFVSALEALFVAGVNQACCCCPDLLIPSKEDIKFTMRELRECNFDLGTNLGRMIVLKKDISFQNMQGALAAFKDFLGVECFDEENVHNVIYALACRHAIVHNLAQTDSKFMNLVKHAGSRSVQREIQDHSEIVLTPAEIRTLQASMTALLGEISDAIKNRVCQMLGIQG